MSEGFPYFDILLFAALAGFLFFRLRSVLGRRTGNERPPENPYEANPDSQNENDNVIPLPNRSEEEGSEEEAYPENPLSAGLLSVKMADRSFDEREFVVGAKVAFEMIVNAFASGDVDTLKMILSDKLYAGFAGAIEEREKAAETQETNLASIRSADIVGASLENHLAHVTIEFSSDQVKVTRDRDGDVIDGDPDMIETITDIWTFTRDVRSNDPNWQLTATSVPED